MAKDNKNTPAAGAEQGAQTSDPTAPAPGADAAQQPAVAGATKEVTRVAPGHSVSSLRGILPDGEVVTARDFFRGDLDLKDLAERGALVVAQEPAQQ